MFKLSYNTNGLRNISIIDAITQIKNYGYEALELSFHDNHIHPLKTDKKSISDIKNICQEKNIDIACIASGADSLLSKEPYEPSLINPDIKGRNERIDLLKKSIEIANLLNAPVLNFASGILKEGIHAEKAYECLCDAIELLVEESDRLMLVIEPEPGFYIGDSAKAIDLIKKINHPRFALNLDIGHVYCCEDNFYEALENAMPYTRHIHIEDIKNKIHHHEIPGEGDINFKKVFEIIERHDYKHYISVELYHHASVWQDALKQSREYLRTVYLGEKIGEECV